jgi:hypothetical protein
MRKLAPAFILTSIVALASSSALAFGDMNKNKKSPSAETTPATTPSSGSTYNTQPAAPNAPTSSYTAPTTPSTSSDNTSKPNASVGADGSTSASMNGSTSATGAPISSTTAASTDSAMVDKDKSKLKKKQAAQNDGRCDASSYPNRNDLPKDCLEKSGTGAAAVSSTQGQSGK